MADASVMAAGPRAVVFVFDRVMHYHRATLQALERRLAASAIRLCVLSARDAAGALGRVADSAKSVDCHERFRLSERQVGRFIVRVQHGMLAQVARHSPAVVVSMCHSGTLTEWALLRWAGRRGVRRVAWQCGYEYNPGLVKRLALARFVPQFDFHLCYHSNARRYALQHGAREEQTLVMHNTIDEAAINAGDKQAARAALVERHAQLAGRRIVLFVGAVLAEKRLETVFDALEELRRSDTMFVVVGDGPHLAALRSRYAQRSDWLAVGSVIAGVGSYFDAADVFVLPGTGGLAINEAMAHRLPVISGYADGSADDLVVDGVTGNRLRDSTSTELAARLAELLDDPARAAAMGRAGEQRIRGELSFANFIERAGGVLEHQHALACRIR
jgi:glycosyltransferase involved in cell wall biosynthesis